MIKGLERLAFLTDRADYILHGYNMALNDISLLPSVIIGAKEVLAGNTTDDEELKIASKKVFRHPYKALDGEYDSENHYIYYRPEKK
ncbi:MAG: hypothetical protein MJ166_07820 [Clostridia bacterium]|nr:hypothetical protein [Clostridia bacterium]